MKYTIYHISNIKGTDEAEKMQYLCDRISLYMGGDDFEEMESFDNFEEAKDEVEKIFGYAKKLFSGNNDFALAIYETELEKETSCRIMQDVCYYGFLSNGEIKADIIKEIYTTYIKEFDRTVIWKYKETNGAFEDAIVGWYFGEPNEADTQEYYGKLSCSSWLR